MGESDRCENQPGNGDGRDCEPASCHERTIPKAASIDSLIWHPARGLVVSSVPAGSRVHFVLPLRLRVWDGVMEKTSIDPRDGELPADADLDPRPTDSNPADEKE